MRRLVFAFGLILGCEDEAPPPPPQQVVEAADTGAAEAERDNATPDKPSRTAAEAAHDLLVGGHFDKALAAAQGLEDQALGGRLVDAAVLSGAKAPDGSDGLLVLEAKLLAGDAAGALAGALAVNGEGTGGAAVLIARSMVDGAMLAEGQELPEATDAFVKWATSSDGSRVRRYAAKAAAVNGWRADRFRAERGAAWGDNAVTTAAFDAL